MKTQIKKTEEVLLPLFFVALKFYVVIVRIVYLIINLNFYIMETTISILILVSIVLLGICISQSVQLKKCKDAQNCEECACNFDLEKACDHLLYVMKNVDVVGKLRYEKECKEVLIKEIKDLFFFEELVDPEQKLKHLQATLNSYQDKPYDEEENAALAKVYQELYSYAKHHIKKRQ